jgi:hypothetical protein
MAIRLSRMALIQLMWVPGLRGAPAGGAVPEAAPAAVAMDAWHCAGPFKDAPFGSLVTSARHVFAPEADVLAGKNAPADLTKHYNSPPYPGYEELTSLA